MKKKKDEKKLSKEQKELLKKEQKELKKASKKKVDKMRLATQIIATLMALMMVMGIAASFMYYFLKML